jgi:hypothetical protein
MPTGHQMDNEWTKKMMENRWQPDVECTTNRWQTEGKQMAPDSNQTGNRWQTD